MNFDKIKAPTVRESFVRELENKILSGELKPRSVASSWA